MTTSIERNIRQPTSPTALPQKRRASAGEVEQGYVSDRSKPVARGRASPIRAWRAAETGASQAAGAEARMPAKTSSAAFRQPFAHEAGAGARPGAVERAVRMRAIEQAWKEEHARLAELEAQER